MRRAWAIGVLALLAACQRQEATPQGAVGSDFALKSDSITLPADADGPLPDVLASNCGACHSAGMILTQPKLKPEQWAATVKKMREVYKAPVAEADVPAILKALEALPAPAAEQLPAAAAAPAAPAP